MFVATLFPIDNHHRATALAFKAEALVEMK
jgi:hypothetical protein